MALELLKNANVAAGMVLPGCQDTGAWRSARCAVVTLTAPARNRPGTAIVQGKRGQYVWTDGNDEEALSRGVFDTYVKRNLRYSQARRAVTGVAARCGCVADRRGPQVAPMSMYEEKNTGSNLPAQVELYASKVRGWPASSTSYSRSNAAAVLRATSITFISWPRVAAPPTRRSYFSRQRHELQSSCLCAHADASRGVVGAAEPKEHDDILGGEDRVARHLGMPAIPPRLGGWRPVS